MQAWWKQGFEGCYKPVPFVWPGKYLYSEAWGPAAETVRANNGA